MTVVCPLHRCEFMDVADNIVLVGGRGTGKTHIAAALGVSAVEHHRKRVRFPYHIPPTGTLSALSSHKGPP